MLKLTLTTIILLAIPSAYAGLETDRIAGQCAALLIILKNPSEAVTAIGLADNQNRAEHFGLVWLNRIKEYISSNNEEMMRVMVFDATGDCSKIGIRPSS